MIADRENEGDMICAGRICDTGKYQFHGIVCKGTYLHTNELEVWQTKLGFPPMVAENTDNHSTAFTIAIDHVETTTGISAAERSFTIMKCCDENSKPEDFRRPGTCFSTCSKRRRCTCQEWTYRGNG